MLLPASSVAVAVSVWLPLVTLVVSHFTQNNPGQDGGGELTTDAPSTKIDGAYIAVVRGGRGEQHIPAPHHGSTCWRHRDCRCAMAWLPSVSVTLSLGR